MGLNYSARKNVSTHFAVWFGKDTIVTPAVLLDDSADCGAELTNTE